MDQNKEPEQKLANGEELAAGAPYHDDTMIHDTKAGSEEPASRSANVTYEEAAKVIEELEKSKARITPRSIREQLGRGSLTHLRDLYKQYCDVKAKEAQAFTALNIDAKDMEMRAKELVSMAVQSNYRIVNEEREYNRRQIQINQERFDALEADYKQEIAQLKADKTSLSEALRKARNEAESLTLKLATKTTEHINLQKEHAALTAINSAQEGMINELKAQIATLIKAVDQMSAKKEEKPKEKS